MQAKMNKVISIITAFVLALMLLQTASALTISDVSSSPSEVEPGEKVRLRLTIENELNDDVENIVISLDLTNLPFAPYQSSNEQTIEEIDNEDEEDVEFQLIIDSDAKSGSYKIPVKMSYYIESEDKEKESEGIISLIVNAKPEIKVSLDTEDVLIKGQKNEVEIKIINSGLGDAKFLNIKINEVSGIKIISIDNIYIGDIDRDDFDVAKFSILINKDAPTAINLPVTIQYKDSRNKEIIETKNIALRTYTTKQAVELGLIKKSKIGLVVGLVVGIIILIFIYRIAKKKRRKRKKEE